MTQSAQQKGLAEVTLEIVELTPIALLATYLLLTWK
jgi:hypothetical protein